MSSETVYEYWRAAKTFLQMSGKIDPDTAHIHFGMLAFLLFYLLFRKKKWPALWAWACVFALQFVNEAIDIILDLKTLGTAREWDSIEDFTATMLWPTVLVGFLWLLEKRRSSGENGP